MIIVYAGLLLGALGLIFGGVLTFASKKFHVDVDERVEQIKECLGGANCGACGFAGCDAFAQALVDGKAPVNGCAPAGAKGIEKISTIMMPILVLMSLGTAIYSLTLDGAIDGLIYYIKPNFEMFSIKTVVAAMGQLFYSMSLAMGIMITFGIFVWYIVFAKSSKGAKIINIVKWVPIIAIVIVILLQIPFIQTFFVLVFSRVDGYNAIQGRTGNWDSAIGTMQTRDLWFGYGDGAEYPYYLAGLADTIYKYGIIGVALEFFCFLYLLMKKFRNFESCYCIVFILLFCFAHLTSVYVQIFNYSILIASVLSSEFEPDGEKTLKT